MISLSLISLIAFTTVFGSDDSYRTKFNPEVLSAGKYSDYSNTPLFNSPMNQFDFPQPPFRSNLIHESHPAGFDAVIGLAAYNRNFLSGYQKIVGSLRHFGYNGHILLGVSPTISAAEVTYLQKHSVTMYEVVVSDCDKSAVGENVAGVIRGKCSTDVKDLKLEWGRYEMARRWLMECSHCTGWTLVFDTRDVFFQDHPFRGLGSAQTTSHDLIFIEEISPYTSPTEDTSRSFISRNPRNFAHTVPCYGQATYSVYGDRPVLCSGTVIGTKDGMLHFLSVLVNEFYSNNRKPNKKCKSPVTTDQWTMNWLYYNGKFGNFNTTITMPWGYGPVLTAGKACITKERKPGAQDLIMRNDEGFLLNSLTHTVAPIVHQYDRCYPWIRKFLNEHSEIYAAT